MARGAYGVWRINCVCLFAAICILCIVGLGIPHEAWGCQNDVLRSESGWERLPDCRGYEMITPPYKEGAIDFAHISSNGEQAIVEGLSAISETPGASENQLVGDAYLDQRTAG